MQKKVIISIFIFLIGMLIYIYSFVDNIYSFKKEEKNIEVFFEREKNFVEPKEIDSNSYTAVLEIPKINLKKGLVSSYSVHNNISENIEILENGKVTSEDENTLILAAHSGNDKISFFRNLDKLRVEDLVYIYHNNYKYIYRVDNFYEEEKGSISIKNNSLIKNVLVLTTCKSNTNDKQLTYIAHFVDKVLY